MWTSIAGASFDAQHLVGIEIGLLDTAVLQRDLAIERRRDAEDDRALDLRLDGVGIDDGAAIDRADDAPDANRSVLRHFDLGDLRQIGREDELDGDAAADSFQATAVPSRPFPRQARGRLWRGATCRGEPADRRPDPASPPPPVRP